MPTVNALHNISIALFGDFCSFHSLLTLTGHFQVALCLGVKTRLRVKPFIENEFRLQVHFHVNHTYFLKKDFARRLVLKQRHKVTRKWSIEQSFLFFASRVEGAEYF